ncbi:MAG: hypothetical protein RLZZ338_2787, partial [Cyanobacteriota bacterium]
GDGAGLEACLFGGTEVGEPAPTELIGWDGVFCPNHLGGCYTFAKPKKRFLWLLG